MHGTFSLILPWALKSVKNAEKCDKVVRAEMINEMRDQNGPKKFGYLFFYFTRCYKRQANSDLLNFSKTKSVGDYGGCGGAFASVPLLAHCSHTSTT